MRLSNKTKKERIVARKRALVLIASCLCVIFSAVILMNLEAPPGARRAGRGAAAYQSGNPPLPVSTAKDSTAARASGVVPLSAGKGTITEADIESLNIKKLLIPVAGVGAGELHDSFFDARSEGRRHEALDIKAPRDTPVLATGDGIVMKLHQSERGGIMLYQSDPSGLYVYYYGHLARYADGIFEGKQIKRGEAIGYVGDTGNAGPGNYHLHFGISKMIAPGKWGGGEPINPYPLLIEQPGTPAVSGK